MRITLASLGFTTTVRVINRVHGRTANGRTNATPAAGASLAEFLEAMLGIADLADRRTTLGRHLAHLAGPQTQGRMTLLAGDQLGRCTGRTRNLRALARLHLDAMNRRTDRDIAQRQRIADLDRCLATGHELVVDLCTLRRNDVT